MVTNMLCCVVTMLFVCAYTLVGAMNQWKMLQLEYQVAEGMFDAESASKYSRFLSWMNGKMDLIFELNELMSCAPVAQPIVFSGVECSSMRG